MIRMHGILPPSYYVACSGGVDSMSVLSFLQNRSTQPKVAYFNHGTEHSENTQAFVESYCSQHSLSLTIGRITRDKLPRESREEHWRNERYKFLHALALPVLTAHNLDDCMETWIFTALNGWPKLIPYRNRNVIRPFRETSKATLIEWCTKRGVPWVEDKSNQDVSYARNRIRHRIMPEALVINPGLAKVIRKKLAAESAL